MKRVTIEEIEEKVANVEYIFPESCPRMTLCVLTMQNGFSISGQAVAADIENFNENLGREMSRKDALTKMWPIESYLRFEKEDNDDAS